MASFSWPVQQSLFNRLKTDTALTALATGGIHDGAPQGTPYPYVVIGETTEVPDDAHARYGSQDTITLHIWSRYAGQKEIKQIAARIHELVHHQTWPVNGAVMVNAQVEMLETLRDPDGFSRHGVLRVRVLAQEA